jgi:hypothetical protein
VLLAAKVLVIARRLYRTLKDNLQVTDFIEKIWSRLSSLRQKLLRMIDQRLVSPKTEENGLLDALCAFALATSSASAADLLRHFHRVRLEALSSTARPSGGHEAVLSNLRLWIRTLQDTRTIFQKPLAAALAKLKAEPILKDAGIQNVSEFNLETHEAWLGDDIRNFTPYLRHDDLAVSAAAQQLSEWAPSALKALLTSLQQSLGTIDDFKEVVQLRQGCLELLFSHYHIAGVRKDVVLSGFREAFSARLQQLVERRCTGLLTVTNTIEKTVQTSSSASFGLPESLWSDKLLHMETSRGVEDFMKTAHDTLHGFTPSIRTFTDQYESWRGDVEAIDEVITNMRKIKWEDHLDLDSDTESDSDEQTESTTKHIQTLLKEADPSTLQSSLSSNLSSAFKEFTASVETLTPTPGSPHAQAQAAFLLRVIREIRQHLPSHTTASALPFTSIPRLHKILALPPVTTVVEEHQETIQQGVKRKKPAGYGLWDGTPPLPTLPSPWAFRLLQDLEAALAEVGTDLWMPDAVTALKDALAEQLVPVLEGAVKGASAGQEAEKKSKGDELNDTEAEGAGADEGAEKGVTSGEGADADADADADTVNDDSRTPNDASDPGLSSESSLQLLFDLAYLSCMDSASSSSDGASAGAPASDQGAPDPAPSVNENSQLPPVRPAAAQLQHTALKRADVDKVAAGRIGKAAVEYRRRTALLFALANS